MYLPSKIGRDVMGGEENEQWLLGKIESVLMLRKSMAERKIIFIGHIVRRGGGHMTKRLILGKEEGKRRRGSRPAKIWFQDINDWTKVAMRMHPNQERWCELISHSSADSATKVERKREGPC